MFKFSKGKKGFTLIELLVVIAIIGILASIVLASLNSARKKSRDVRRIADIKQLQLAAELYFDSSSSYPVAFTVAGFTPSGGSPTIPSIPTDPVGATAYKYAYYPAASPTYYHMGAGLEESGNTALSSDKDCDSSIAATTCGGGAAYTGGFNSGGDVVTTATTCTGVVSRYCYDVVP